MLTIIVTKLLLKGAIKTFIVKPAIKSTLNVIPQSNHVQANLLNHRVIFTTGDLIKFGAETLFDHFLGKKLDFQIEKLSKLIFGISPANEFAELFAKEYIDEEELIIDLTKFEEYLDSISDLFQDSIDASDTVEIDRILNEIIQDMDLAIKLSENQMFKGNEQSLVDEILKKNMKSMKKDEINALKDFPQVPNQKVSDEAEIKKILSKFS